MRILLALTVMLVAAGCSGRTADQPAGEHSFVTSFDAIRLVVQPMVGDMPVRTLLPPGTSPHAYSPRPSEARVMQEAVLVVHAHADIDGWVADLAPDKAYAMFSAESSLSPENGHEHQDAHFWTDPLAISRSLQPLATALCAVDHTSCPLFRRRSNVLRSRVDSLHVVLLQRASERRDNCLISSEPFADRMLERYGIPHEGPLRISADVPPTPTRLSRVIRDADAAGCRRLLVQSALENRMERQLAEEHGWEIVEVDPLGAAAPDLLTYLSDLFDALTLPPAAHAP